MQVLFGLCLALHLGTALVVLGHSIFVMWIITVITVASRSAVARRCCFLTRALIITVITIRCIGKQTATARAWHCH
jgi:hypothetical protein